MGVRDTSTGTGRAPGGAEGLVLGTAQREGEHGTASPGLHSIHFKHFCFVFSVMLLVLEHFQCTKREEKPQACKAEAVPCAGCCPSPSRPQQARPWWSEDHECHLQHSPQPGRVRGKENAPKGPGLAWGLLFSVAAGQLLCSGCVTCGNENPAAHCVSPSELNRKSIAQSHASYPGKPAPVRIQFRD